MQLDCGERRGEGVGGITWGSTDVLVTDRLYSLLDCLWNRLWCLYMHEKGSVGSAKERAARLTGKQKAVVSACAEHKGFMELPSVTMPMKLHRYLSCVI